MRWKRGGTIEMITRTVVLVTLLTINACDGARRTAQRRKDTSRTPDLYEPTPSAESLQAIAEAMGAAGFEHYTEGRPLVKRLIPVDNQSDLDLVEQQGTSVIGKAGVDFPAYPNIPNTGFSCKNVPTGYYADLETDCQVFHICDTSRKISFLCPNGTIFSQSHLICDWWFKVDCASAPALYESSAEYYSNEQKKSQKVSQSLSKNYQQENDNRAESRRASVNVPSTTERLLRHRQRLQTDTPLNINGRPTPRTIQTLFENYNPTQRSQLTTAFENRRRNLVQLISNNFGNSQVKTTPTYTEASTYRTPGGEFNGLKEMQVAAETASFANNNNRQFLQDFHTKNYRPYPVYTPNTVKPKPKPKSNPNLTTLYDIRDKNSNQIPQESTTTKRPTLVPYTKSYVANDNRDPYTRPGVSLLKGFLQKEKNKTLAAPTTEKISQATDRSDNYDKENRVTIETKDSFESVTRIPHTTRAVNVHFSETASDKYDVQASTNYAAGTTEPSYQERRERLMRKLNLDQFGPTEPTLPPTASEKYYGDLPNRPGLVVPPSLTPKTLHSLAIYYATALDNLSTTPNEDSETTTPAFYDYENVDGLPGLFSPQTINKYSNLFGQAMENAELLEEIKVDPNGTYNELSDDLSVQQSQNPIATSPQIRELAQVFTHALSAYLQDPVQFRKVLSDIRPTHPSFGDLLSTTEESFNTEPTTTVNEEDDEILGFSDDNKIRPAFTSVRDPKALSLATDYPTVTEDFNTTPGPTTTEVISTTYLTTTPRIPFRCCGRISATYTTSSTPLISSTTSNPITNTFASTVNTLVNNYSETTTENTYSIPRFGGFQNNIITGNDSPYGKGSESLNAKPLNDYVEATNLPTAWGIDSAASTNLPAINTDEFESKKIRPTTYAPTTTHVYFTETDSVELENEEELQRAHSQSFAKPQENNIRQGKQLNFEETKPTIKKPSEDLEAPTLSDFDTTTAQTTAQPTTTLKIEETEPTTASPLSGSIFTSPDSGSTYIWSSTFDNWHSTVIDPITLNDGLSPSGPEQVAQLARETNGYIPSTTNDYTATTEQAYSSTVNIELSTPINSNQDRSPRLLKDTTSTEPSQDLSAITDTVVEKAKEIMGGMNATTTEKLMNVMKKTKSKTVRRLILLLVQTCDDDHNTTAEASKKALLEALMAVSQKDMDEIAKEEGVTDIQPTANDYETTSTDSSRTDRPEARTRQERRGKSLNFDPSAINSLSNSVTTENVKTTTEDLDYASTTLSPRTTTNKRGLRKFFTRTPDIKATRANIEGPTAEARVAPQGSDVKGVSDTRALELLRSLYSIAARWG